VELTALCSAEWLCHQEVAMPMPVINHGDLAYPSHGPQQGSGATGGLI